MGSNLDCSTHEIGYTDFNSTINISKPGRTDFLQLSACFSQEKSCHSSLIIKEVFSKNCNHIALLRPCFQRVRHFEWNIMFLVWTFSLLTIESEYSRKPAGFLSCLSKLTSQSPMLLIWFYFCMCQIGYFINSYTAAHWQVYMLGNHAVLSIWCLFLQAHYVQCCILPCAVQWSRHITQDSIQCSPFTL